MTNKDKSKLLYDRHIKFVIEWGGTDLFTNASDMSIEGMTELLDILKLKTETEINDKLTALVQKEHDKQD